MSDSATNSVQGPARSSLGNESLRDRLVKGSAYSFAAMVLGQAFALVTSILYARLLGRDSLGVLSVYAQLSSLVVTIAALGLATPVTRYVARYRTSDPMRLGRILSTTFVATIVATGFVAIVMLAFGVFIGVGFYRSPELVPMIRLLSVFLAFNSLSGLGVAILQGLQRIKRLSLVGIFLEALTIPVMFVSLSLLGLVGAAAGGAAVVIVATVLLLAPAVHELRLSGIRIQFTFDGKSARDLASYALPLLGSATILRIGFLVQTSLLVIYLGFGDVGLFRVGSSVARVVAFISSSLSVPLLPAMTELHGSATADHNRSRLTTILRISSYAGAPIALGIGLFAGVLIGFFYGGEYSAAAPLTFVLVIAGFLDIIGVVAANSLLADARTGTLLTLDVIQALIITTATAAFVPTLGVIGAGYAALLTSASYSAVILLLLGRRHRVDVGRVVAALLPAAAIFGFATIAILLGNAQVNLWFGGAVVAVAAVISWLLMAPPERHLVRSVPRVLLHGWVN